jgi:hypothetical protein
MRDSEKLWEIFVCIENNSILLWFIIKIVFRSWRKLFTQSMIYIDIFRFRKSWISRSCEIVSNASATFRLNKITIRFVFLFYTMWIYSINISSVVSIDLLLRHLICVFRKNRWVFASHTIFLFIIDFIILSMMFKRIMSLYDFEIV